jgi:hypothetical protein
MIALVAAAPVAEAQQLAPDFTGLPIKPGDTIFVTDLASGVEVGGRLRALSAGALSIDGYEFRPAAGLRIERRGDPIWDGAAYGFGVGVLAGITIGAEACLHRPAWHCVVESGVSYAAVGTLMDWRHKGRTRVYESGSPLLWAHSRALG